MDAKLVAGSTDWGVDLNLKHARAELSIGIDRLPELRAYELGDDTTGLFKVLKDISAGLRSGDGAGVRASLTQLDSSADKLNSAVSEIGSRYNRITQMKDSAQDRA